MAKMTKAIKRKKSWTAFYKLNDEIKKDEHTRREDEQWKYLHPPKLYNRFLFAKAPINIDGFFFLISCEPVHQRPINL